MSTFTHADSLLTVEGHQIQPLRYLNGSLLTDSLTWIYSTNSPKQIVYGSSFGSGERITLFELKGKINSTSWGNYGWLETQFYIDSTYQGIPLHAVYSNREPARIWLNGKQILEAGNPSKTQNNEISPRFNNLKRSGVLLNKGTNTLLIEFSTHHKIDYFLNNSLFKRTLNFQFKPQVEFHERRYRSVVFGGTGLLLLLLIFIHLFLSYKSVSDYHIYVACCSFFTFLHGFTTLSDSLFDWTYAYVNFFNYSFSISFLLAFFFYILAIRKVLSLPIKTNYYIVVLMLFSVLSIGSIIVGKTTRIFTILSVATIVFFVVSIFSFYKAWSTIPKQKIGVLVGGLTVTVFGALSYTLVHIIFGINSEFLFYLSVLLSYSGIPVSLTLYVIQSYTDLFYSLEIKIKTRTKELEESIRFKTDFLSNISHEFITPLAICKNVLHLVKQPNQSEIKIKQDLSIIEDNLNRLHNMVKQLLELTQTDQRTLKLNKSKFLANQFYKEVVDVFIPLFKSKNLLVVNNWSNEQVLINADKNRVYIILSNLISNAIKFSPANGNLFISTKVLNEHFIFEIQDSGIGIPTGFEELIFDRFHRIYQKNVDYVEGAGIGLELSRSLARLQHGDIIADPNQNNGAKFSFLLPILTIEEQRLTNNFELNEKLSETKENQRLENYETQNRKILVVEDNLDMQQTVGRILESLGEITFANNGKEALKVLESLKPDLIISDLMMPVMNGTELVKTVLQKEFLKDIPILILTAKNLGEEKTDLLSIGVIDYITKPFNPEHFILKVQNLLRLFDKRRRVVLSIPETEKIQTHVLHQKLAAYVLDHINDSSFTLEQIADYLKQSRRTLFRAIETETGMSPGDFIREIRLQKALEIIQTNKTIRLDELAYSVGYKTSNGFKKAFIDRFGFHPTKKNAD